jgi:molybdopterin converting factor small subunit
LFIKIKVLGLPLLTELIGKENVLECPKKSVKGLVDVLIVRYGATASHAILDKTENLDRSIQIVINDRDYVKPQDLDKTLLKDGDSVTFMMLIAGG